MRPRLERRRTIKLTRFSLVVLIKGTNQTRYEGALLHYPCIRWSVFFTENIVLVTYFHTFIENIQQSILKMQWPEKGLELIVRAGLQLNLSKLSRGITEQYSVSMHALVS